MVHGSMVHGSMMCTTLIQVINLDVPAALQTYMHRIGESTWFSKLIFQQVELQFVMLLLLMHSGLD